MAYGQGTLSVSDDRTFCVLSHALAPIFYFLAPLIIWLIKKPESPAVDAHGKESLNFQINITAWSLILVIVSCGLFAPVAGILWLYSVVLCVIASLKASEGQFYRYPLILRLIK